MWLWYAALVCCVVVQAGDDVFVVQMILSITSFDEFKVHNPLNITPQQRSLATHALPLLSALLCHSPQAVVHHLFVRQNMMIYEKRKLQ